MAKCQVRMWNQPNGKEDHFRHCVKMTDTLPSSWRLRSWACCGPFGSRPYLCLLRTVNTNCLSLVTTESSSSTLFPRALRVMLGWGHWGHGHERTDRYVVSSSLPRPWVMVIAASAATTMPRRSATNCNIGVDDALLFSFLSRPTRSLPRSLLCCSLPPACVCQLRTRTRARNTRARAWVRTTHAA